MRRMMLFVSLLLAAAPLMAAGDGLVRTQSRYSVERTAQRLVQALEEKGMTVMAQVDHAANARRVGKELRPTRLVIFGNPRVGTPLMRCSQTVAIDLPQKALIWEDAEGVVWLAYNEPEYLAYRHGVAGCADALAKVEAALAGFARAATR
ncbi:DUF302 domain-containing protein [Alkalilimnicola sp. S0819]|uniref:DUF302 domain-containing protein n=1 Tax=Alkalilimnicola sp. S0819 TaxID=2613922 RepID=UPI0012614D47|nr:DUF302 domain-containing protein [Alkalilimnicola sp. S0819]KAB7624093.1 DUF302 domain-containing protein [Alkalilimnicola sp. S0819]MPQ16344.1 DUF302 domain-containing protein [Alkalilimnicola sp. S0819]